MNNDFQELIRIIGFMPKGIPEVYIATGKWELDIVWLDQAFSRKDPEYDNVNGLYKSSPCTMAEYVQQKYGERAVEIIRQLI